MPYAWLSTSVATFLRNHSVELCFLHDHWFSSGCFDLLSCCKYCPGLLTPYHVTRGIHSHSMHNRGGVSPCNCRRIAHRERATACNCHMRRWSPESLNGTHAGCHKLVEICSTAPAPPFLLVGCRLPGFLSLQSSPVLHHARLTRSCRHSFFCFGSRHIHSDVYPG